MNHIKIIILLLCSFGNTMVFAQKAQFKKADKAYKAKNYSEAIPLYEEGLALDDNLSRKTKLANSYRMINQLDKAATLFREVVRDPKAKPITYLYLGESLMGSGNYDEAKYWFQQYHTKEPEDQKALLLIAACNQVKDIKSIFPDMGVIPFAQNSEVDDNAPIFWQNQILFSSDRNQGIKLLKQKSGVTGRDYIQIYSAAEANNFTYSDPKPYSGKVNELNKNSANISISQDGTRAVFSRNSKDANKKNTHTIQLFEMTSTDGKKWKNVKEINFSNNAYNYMHPALSPDGNTLFFVSDKGSGEGGTDLYVSYYKKEKWSRPVNLGPVINTDANEGFPFFDKDGKLFFCSKGHAGFGGFDIFFSTQDSETEQWDVPINVGAPVNSPADDISIFIDQESRRALFTSSRNGGDDDIYLGWLDGLPDELKETETIVPDPQPEIAETVIDTAIESVDPVVNVQTETVEIKTEIPAPALVETPVETTTEQAAEIVKTEEAIDIKTSETAAEIPVTNPTEIVSETMAAEEISEAIKEADIELPTTQSAQSIQVSNTETVIETNTDAVPTVEAATEAVEEIVPAPATTPAPEPTPVSTTITEQVIEKETPTVEEPVVPNPDTVTPPSVPTTQVEVSNTETVIETNTDAVPTVEAATEVVEEIVPAPATTPAPEPTPVSTTITEQVIEKETPIVPNPATATPPSVPVDENLPTPLSTPTTENSPKEEALSTTMPARSSFSTLKKDLKKKRSTAGKIYRLKNISYDPGGYLVAKAHGGALDEVVKLMKQNPTITIELASHTYSVGHDQTNLKLSQNRAKRAVNYLVEKGINPERIFAVGYGEKRILNHCTNGVACTQAEHAENERLEIQIMDEAH